jgi:tetratricopeptide (TPR) repeat protein
MDQRAACLARAAGEVSAFVAELGQVDRQSLAKAGETVGTVGDVSPCADAATLGRIAPEPGDPAKRRAIAEARRDLDELKARVRSGRTRDLTTRGPAIIERARAIGWAPLYAEALFVAAQLAEKATHLPEAAQDLEQASLEAEAGSDDVLRFDSEMALGRLLGYELDRDHDGIAHLDRAEALLRRLGNEDKRQASLLLARGTVDWWSGRFQQARPSVDRAVKILERLDPLSPGLVRAYHLQGIVLDDLHDDVAALATFTHAEQLAERVLGPSHPTTATTLNSMSGSLRRLGRYNEAKAAIERAQAILIAASGPVSVDVAGTWGNLGNVYDNLGQWDQAIECKRKALALNEQIYGPDHARVADSLTAVAGMLSKLHRSGAEELFQRALTILRNKRPANDPIIAETITRLGEHYALQGRHQEAIAQYQAAVTALEASLGPKNGILVWPLRMEAASLGALHRWTESIAMFERVSTIAPENDSRRPQFEMQLARVLRDSGRDPARAVKLAQQARARYVAEGPGAADDVKEVDAWLKTAGGARK